MADSRTTYDGKPIAAEPPFGATVVIYRRGPAGLEFLILHRAHDGAAYEGDWAWTPPAGARWPDEAPDECAQRELSEETGLSVVVRRTQGGSADWLVYEAEVSHDAVVALDAEHDRYEWISLGEASRCQPDRVAKQIVYVGQLLT